MSIYIKPHHIEKFKPTWLMIKQHNKTGLKYFCKTTRKNPHRYKGSGVAWCAHLKEHGTDITTTWCQLFDDINELVKYAIEFSSKHDIVNSLEWANKIPENGLGSVVGQKGHPQTLETRSTMNATKKGVPRTEEAKNNISLATVGKKKTKSKKLLDYWKRKKGCQGNKSGLYAWNNGSINKFSKEQPEPGFVRGLIRISRTKNNPAN